MSFQQSRGRRSTRLHCVPVRDRVRNPDRLLAVSEEMTLPAAIAVPAPGQVARVRSRRYVVEDVVAPPAPGEQTLVRLACLEDDSSTASFSPPRPTTGTPTASPRCSSCWTLSASAVA